MDIGTHTQYGLGVLVIIALIGGTFLWFSVGTQEYDAPTLNDATSTPPVVIGAPDTATSTEEELPPSPIFSTSTQQYIEIIDSCGPYFQGDCVNVRSAPNASSTVIRQLRTGTIVRVNDLVTATSGSTWYHITFEGEWLRYPDRVTQDWYVSADYGRFFTDVGSIDITSDTPTTTKRIIVDRSEQMLYAYDGNELFMEQAISTGLNETPTPRGEFRIFRKTPSRYMQGPIPGISTKQYDLPGVPWDMYFTHGGAVIHGAYWHDNFGKKWSNGCVNMPIAEAEKLYKWTPLGTKVTVRD